MMTMLSGFPDNVLAVKASGHITRKDYETVLIPAAKAALATHDKLRVYYEVAPDFSGVDMGAMWEDFTLGIGHLTRWERVAVVTGVDWIKHSVNAFRFIMPCPVKVFAPDEEAQARTWVQQEK